MASRAVVAEPGPRTRTPAASGPDATAIGGAGFDWLMAVLGGWLIGGLYLDGWAHIHVPALETFFTPWHAVLYSGYIAGAVALAVTVRRNRRRGAPRARALPAGYGLSLVGVFVFFFAGVADMLWHVTFGIEERRRGAHQPEPPRPGVRRRAHGDGAAQGGARPPGAGGTTLARPDAHGRVPDALPLAHHVLHGVREPIRDDVGRGDPADRQRRRTCQRGWRASWSSRRC